jgi:hypothetical protein
MYLSIVDHLENPTNGWKKEKVRPLLMIFKIALTLWHEPSHPFTSLHELHILTWCDVKVHVATKIVGMRVVTMSKGGGNWSVRRGEDGKVQCSFWKQWMMFGTQPWSKCVGIRLLLKLTLLWLMERWSAHIASYYCSFVLGLHSCHFNFIFNS